MKNIIQFARAAAMTTLLVLLLTAAQTAWAKTSEPTDPPAIDGLEYNSVDGYYAIPDADALSALSSYVNANHTCEGLTFKVTANVTFTKPAEGESNFTAIGTEDYPFCGIFDGGNNCGYSISGIRINASTSNQGLFGYVSGKNAKIQNVTIKDSKISSNSTKCKNYGGIVGYNMKGTISNCTSSAEITATANSSYNYGGIVGYNREGTIENCTSRATVMGTVTWSYYYGGIVGENSYGTISNNLAVNAKISSESTWGTIAGYNGYGTLKNNYYSNCTVKGTPNATGVGCKGEDIEADDGAMPITTNNILVEFFLSECFEITNGVKFLGNNCVEAGKEVKFVPKFGYKLTSGVTMNGKPIEPTNGIYTVNVNEETTISATFIKDVWEIYTVDDLKKFSEMVNGGKSFEGVTVTLMKSIDFKTADGVAPIGTDANPFKGTFDGGGKTLTLALKGGDKKQFLAPFSFVDGATFRDLIVDGTIESEFEKSGDGTHGGFVGVSKSTTKETSFENCAFVGSLLGVNANSCGGFVGWASGKINYTNCLFAPTEITMSEKNSATFNRGNTDGAFTTCYYTQPFGTEQGVKVFKLTLPEGFIIQSPEKPTASYNETKYYKAGIEVKLSGNPEGKVAVVNNTVIHGNTFTMPDEDVVVTLEDKPGYSFILPECFEIINGVELIYGEYIDPKTTTVQFAPKYGYKVTSVVKKNNIDEITATNGIYTVNVNEETTISATFIKDVWEIYTVDDLKKISEMVNGGKTFEGETVTLMKPIDFKTADGVAPIGTDANPFKGTFDGGGKTLTLALKGGDKKQFLAPFSFVDGATFRDLIVDGTIESEFEKSGDGTHGGFVGVSKSTTKETSFENCAFVGSLLGVNANSCGGFVGWASGKINYTNCLFAPTEITMSEKNSATFNRNPTTEDYSTCYYTQSFGAVQGVKVFKLTLPEGFFIQSPEKPTASYNETKYYKAGIEVKLSGIPEGKVAFANSTVIHGNTFTMPDEDVAVTLEDKPGYSFILPECFEIINGVELIYGEYIDPKTTTVQFAPKYGYKVTSVVKKNNIDEITATNGIYTVEITGETTISANFEKVWAIYTVDDLKKISEMVNGGKSFEDETVTLMKSIDFKTSDGVAPIGTKANPFKGTFDGGGKKLTCYLSGVNKQQYLAPFSYVDGATFCNLIVDGTIESVFEKSGDGTHGGFVGVSNGGTKFENCAFVGRLLGSNAHSCGGFVGWATKPITYTNCLFAPKEITMSEEGSTTFNRNPTTEDYSTCYYTQSFGAVQGVKVYKTTDDIPQNTICKKIELADGEDYYVPAAVIEGLRFDWESNAAIFTAVKFGGETLTKDKDYTVEHTIKEAATGKYTLTIEGQRDYAGTVTKDYEIFSGDGTADAPYIITTTDHLDAFSAFVNGGGNCNGKHFKLGASIKYDGKTENNFTAIGTSTHRFDGTFDGGNDNGYTISGIVINAKTSYQGLFGYAGSDALIKNVTIEKSEIKSSQSDVGGIVGCNRNGTIKNCTSSAEVTGIGGVAERCGGIVGSNFYGTISNCTSSAVVTATGSSYYYGGIVGRNSGSISNNLAIEAEISSTARFYGTIAGENSGTLQNNYYYCTVNGNGNAKGVGCGGENESKDIEDNDGAVPAPNNLIQFFLPECFEITSNTKLFGANYVENGTKIQFVRKFGYILSSGVTCDNGLDGPDEDGIYTVTVNAPTTISATYSKSWAIYTVRDLNKFSEMVNGGDKFEGKTLTLMNSISFTKPQEGESNFTAIGTEKCPFCGTFDGGNNKGYSISGIVINAKTNYQGLFGYVSGEGATIQNVTVKDSEIKCSGYNVGGIVGYNKGKLSNNLFVESEITSYGYYGAIVGNNYNGALYQNYYYNCTVNGTENATGVGHYNNDITKDDGAVAIHTITLADGVTITGPDSPTVEHNKTNYYKAGIEVELSGIPEGNVAVVNDAIIDGNTFTMPDKDVVVEVKDYCKFDMSECFEITSNVEFIDGIDGKYVKSRTEVQFASKFGYIVSDVTCNGKPITHDKGIYTVTVNAPTSISAVCQEGYAIYTPEDLNKISEMVNQDGQTFKGKTVKLMNSITFTKPEEGKSNFTAIGTRKCPFCGSFDGGNDNGFTISGIVINAKTSYQGLFGYVEGKDVTIKNVTIVNTTISSSADACHYYGGIVGYNRNGTISNCTSSATVSATRSDCSRYGGIAGYNGGGTIEKCISSATVSATRSDCSRCGGIAGYNDGGTLSNNYSMEAEIKSSSLYGAIVGYNNNGGILSYNYYYNCKVNEDENATGVGCGGYDGNADIEENNGAVAVHKLMLPDGISITSPDRPTVIPYETDYYCKAGVKIKLDYTIPEDKVALANNTVIHNQTFTMPDENVKVTVGNKPEGCSFILPECFEITNGVELIYGGYIDPKTTEIQFAPKFGYEVTSAVTKNNNEEITVGDDGIYTVEITGQTTISAEFKTGVWKIYTARHLQGFSEMVNNGKSFEGKTVTLMNSITFTKPANEDASNFTAIGTSTHPFKGTFDGGNNTISGIRINASAMHQGLFGYVNGSNTIQNVIIKDAVIKSSGGYVGGIVGYNSDGTISNCTSSAKVSATGENCNYYGGIAGYNIYGTIENCTSSAEVSTSADNCSYYGGIVGSIGDGTIKDCISSATVSATGSDCDYFGGIVGDVFWGTLTDNLSINAEVSCLSNFGAIAGRRDEMWVTLSNNYYYNCKINEEGNATGVGCNGADINNDKNPDGAVHVDYIIDGENTEKLSFAVGTYNRVLYLRNLTADIPTTIMLPFEFKASDFGNATFSTFSGVNTKEWKAIMTEVKAGADNKVHLSANTPYIFQPTQNATMVAFENVTVTTEGLQLTSDDNGWTFQGTYEKQVWNTDKNNPRTTTNVYGFAATAKDNIEGEPIIAAGEFVRAGYNVSIKPTRAYLIYTGDDNSLRKSAIALPDRIKVVFIDKETATVIDDPNITDDPNVDISTPTSEIQPALDNVKVWSYDKTIFISARPGTDYRIIDANGRLLRASTTQSDRDEIRLGRASGIVIVIIGNKAYKLNY